MGTFVSHQLERQCSPKWVSACGPGGRQKLTATGATTIQRPGGEQLKVVPLAKVPGVPTFSSSAWPISSDLCACDTVAMMDELLSWLLSLSEVHSSGCDASLSKENVPGWDTIVYCACYCDCSVAGKRVILVPIIGAIDRHERS